MAKEIEILQERGRVRRSALREVQSLQHFSDSKIDPLFRFWRFWRAPLIGRARVGLRLVTGWRKLAQASTKSKFPGPH